MRLIDADALREVWLESDSLDNDDTNTVLYSIDEQPTVDAEPVRHGYWIEHEYAEEENDHLVSNYACSACHSWERYVSNYCPNCGAKMDEEEVKNCCNCEFGDSNVDEPPCSECHSNDIKWEREVE